MKNKKNIMPLSLSVKSIDEENFTIDAVVSTQSLDADREIVLASAWKNFNRYKSNPVLMSSHDIYSLDNIIGRCLSIKKIDKTVECKFEYFVGQGNEKADWAFAIAKKGMAAFSVGFLVNELEFDPSEISEIVKSEKLELEKGKRLNAIITNAELYEVSQVAVGSNKDALMKTKSFNCKDSEFDKIYDEIKKEIDNIYLKVKSKKEKSIVPFHSYPLAENGQEWDADKEVTKIRTWAGYDGEDKDTVDWEKYAIAFTWVVTEDIENFSSYKFPHHSIEDGNIKTHRRGVIAAMQRLLGSSNMPEENKKQIYDHLAEHYTKDMETEPPEFKKIEEDDKKQLIDVQVNLQDLVELVVNKVIKSIHGELSEIKDNKYEELLKKTKILDKIQSDLIEIKDKFVTIKEKEEKDNDLYSSLLSEIDENYTID